MNTTIFKCALLFIFISYSAFGQTEKGSKLLGGSFHLSTDKSDNSDRIYRVYAIPNLGIFLKDNLAVGGVVNLGYSKSDDTRDLNFGIAPFLRYYFKLNKIWLFLQGQPGYYWSQSKSTSGEKSSNDYLGIGLGIGLTYFITDNIGIEGILSYNLAFNVSFQIYLPKGKKE